MKLTEHFTLAEMKVSQVAARNGIDNNPGPAEIAKLTELCKDVLEPLRIHANTRIRVSSGYRSEAVNKAIGGASNSQHMFGEAADITPIDLPLEEFFEKIKDLVKCRLLQVDQCIYEFDSWVHISYRKGKNRNQFLRAVKVDGMTVYRQETV
jgi:zinc D-Ala-D-Ala carboxypeptidase